MDPVQQAKHWLVETLMLSKDALHIYVGLAVFLLTSLIFRLPLRDLRPIAAVVLVALLGEVVDLVSASAGGRRLVWGASWHDLRNTVTWPLILFALARFNALRT